ncbi:MAG: hypothetical protein DRP70_14270 [Spirochaetes bacterium]|nr:MAG: hypothetical protein DRP70_14270 [Spirochaetota bacterium]
MNIQRLITLMLILVNLMAVSARGNSQSVSLSGDESLPVSGVTLFSSGVGHFLHEGLVRGDVEITLVFDADDMDDLLKSLVLQDYDGGFVEAVTYPSKDPMSRILGSFSLNIADNPPLAQLLERARGEEVHIEGTASVDGTIVGIEYRAAVSEGVTIQVPVINLINVEGLRQVDLTDIRTLQFLDPVVQADLDSALGVIAANRQEDKKILTLRFSGEGERRVSVSYIREVPVWKTSYRLVLEDDGTAQLQGWAMVENTGENDWNDISLALASGQPISFVIDLYSPIYVPRPRVLQEYGSAAAPQLYDRDRVLAAAPGSMDKSQLSWEEESYFEADIDKSLNLFRGVTTAAQSDGESLYNITRPVSVPRREAAMLPIIGTSIPAERLSIYDSSVLEGFPLKGVRITNNTDLQLPAGPATLFEGSVYGGDIRLPSMSEGEERLLSYAVDLESNVILHSFSDPEEITELKIIEGSLESTVRLVSTTEYAINRLGDKDAHYLIIHPKKPGWSIEGENQPSSETQNSWRFEIDVEAGKSVSLPVVEEYVQSRKFTLNTIRDDQIVYYLSRRVINNETRKTLERIRELRSALAARVSERRKLETRIAVIYHDQDRIRDNIQALESGSELYRRYVEILNGQEDELQGINDELKTAVNAETQARQTLEDYIGEQ